jgi:hypothetical protein
MTASSNQPSGNCAGQSHAKDAATSNFTFQFHRAAGSFNRPFDNRQPQADAAFSP